MWGGLNTDIHGTELGGAGLCHPHCSQRGRADESELSQLLSPCVHAQVLQEIIGSLASQDLCEGDCGCSSFSQVLSLVKKKEIFNNLQASHHFFEGPAVIKYDEFMPFSWPVY